MESSRVWLCLRGLAAAGVMSWHGSSCASFRGRLVESWPSLPAYLESSLTPARRVACSSSVYCALYLVSDCEVGLVLFLWFCARNRLFQRSRYLDDFTSRNGYAPLFKSFENFFTRRLYHRIQVCLLAPILLRSHAHCYFKIPADCPWFFALPRPLCTSLHLAGDATRFILLFFWRFRTPLSGSNPPPPEFFSDRLGRPLSFHPARASWSLGLWSLGSCSSGDNYEVEVGYSVCLQARRRPSTRSLLDGAVAPSAPRREILRDSLLVLLASPRPPSAPPSPGRVQPAGVQRAGRAHRGDGARQHRRHEDGQVSPCPSSLLCV